MRARLPLGDFDVLAQLAQAPRLAGWTLDSLRQAAQA